MTTASISVAFRVSSQDTEALIDGRSITIMPLRFMRFGQQFALYPDRPEQSESKTVLIRAWARCELCQNLYESQSVDVLAQLLNLSPEELSKIFSERGHIFLAYLRVYLLPQPIEIPINPEGQFVPLPQNFYFSDDSPVLDDYTFTKLKYHLENLELPEPLDVQIGKMLEEAELQYKLESEKELAWINKIAKVGNSSGGHEFEKLVRKSFIALGFSNSNTNPKASLDPEATGGAGGIDLCCEHPYPVVGECKASASRSIPTEVCSQLTYLGQGHFPEYEKAIKIIIAAGSLNHHSNPIAIGNKMNVIRPETLEKLVKLKTTYAGSINLWKLKDCLEQEPFGEEANSKLVKFIEACEHEIKLEINLRSHIVQTVKEEQGNNPSVSITEIRATYNAKYVTNPQQRLDDKSTRDILIELSSPLAGYLGREKGNDWESDRFYFLRDLPTEKEP